MINSDRVILIVMTDVNAGKNSLILNMIITLILKIALSVLKKRILNMLIFHTAIYSGKMLMLIVNADVNVKF